MVNVLDCGASGSWIKSGSRRYGKRDRVSPAHIQVAV